MRRPLATATLLLVLATAAFVPAANAQETNLNSCSFSPDAITLGPGEAATVTLTTDPVVANIIGVLAFDDEVLLEEFDTAESGPSVLTYETLVGVVEAATGVAVTSGVLDLSYGVILPLGDDERFEALCTLSITLTGEPEPTTTTVAPEPSPIPEPAPDPEPATPRFTG
jgi:hypothetical protein